MDAEHATTEILRSTPEYSRGFLDGRKYALSMVLRLIKGTDGSFTIAEIKETIERLLGD